MLSGSFCCFRGLSPEAEQRLWRLGCLKWSHLPRLAHRLISVRKTVDLVGQIPLLQAALQGRVADVFIKRLPVGHRLRLLPEFSAGIGFLDIETTGLARTDDITVIGLHLGGRLRQYVRGVDLDEFLQSWRAIEVLVTYNGAAFDLPHLARHFGLSVMPPHIDLRHEARAYGLIGGLKVIEKKMGLYRTSTEAGDGALAAEWWASYAKHNDTDALKRLLAYNAQDAASLPIIAEFLWKRSMQMFPA